MEDYLEKEGSHDPTENFMGMILKSIVSNEKEEFELSRTQLFNGKNPLDEISFMRIAFEAIYHLFLGLADLKQEQLDSVKAQQLKLESLTTESKGFMKILFRYYQNVLRAEVLIEKNYLDEAINVLEELSLSGFSIWGDPNFLIYRHFPFYKDGLARAYQQKGDLEKAIKEYEKLIKFDLVNKKDNFYIHPKYHYRLAKLYEQTGQNSKAIEHYEKFLSLWKDADPGIAKVDDARERLAGLK